MEDIHAALLKGMEHHSAGRYREAEAVYLRILESDGSHVETLCARGILAADVGNIDHAIALFRKVVRIRSGHIDAHMNLGQLLRGMGKLEESLACFEKALAISPDRRNVREIRDIVQEDITTLNRSVASFGQDGVFPRVVFSDEERASGNISVEGLNLAERLMSRYGVVLLENMFDAGFIKSISDYFRHQYRPYFHDREYPDALYVGEKRNMITLRMESAINDPQFYANPLLMPILARVLGNGCVLGSLGAVVSLPGSDLQHLHQDCPNLFGDDAIGTKIPCFAVTVVIPMLELNEVTGTTRFFKGSHRIKRHPRKSEYKYFVDAFAGLGSCVIWDYRTYHQGTENTSRDIRPIFYNVYRRPWFRDAVNYNKQPALKLSDEEYSRIPERYKSLLSWSRGPGETADKM